MTNKSFINQRVLWLLIPLLTLFNVSVWGTDYDDVATFDSDDVVTNSSYDTYQNDNWYLSKGGNNVSGGFNSSNKVTIGNAYGTSANTSHHGFYILSKNKLSKICKITFEYTGGSNTSDAKLYLGYSTDGSSWSAVTLTTGSQGMSVGSTSTEYTMIFSEISSAYYALIVSANGTLSSKNAFRFDNITAVFYQEDVPAVPYTVTFNAEGGDCETSSLTEENAGDGVELPEATTDCSSDGWAFYGWATSACSSSTGTAPTIVGKAGDTYYPADDITLHAVFAKGEFTKITSTDDLSSGAKYLIVVKYSSKNYILKSSSDDYNTTSHKMASAQVDETSTGKYHITAIDPNWRYSIEGSTGNWRIRDVVNATNNYLDVAYTDWWGNAYDSDDPYRITVSAGGVWSLNCHYWYNSKYNDGYLSFDETNKLFQAKSSTYSILLYKQTTTPAYWSSPTCCEKPSALTKGSINASSQTVSWTAPASAPAGGYYVAYSTATSSDPGNDVYSTSGNYTVMAISAGTTTANIPCNTAGTYNWWVRSKCSSSDNTSCSGWVKGTAWTMKTIYLNTNYDWNAGGAKFAVHYWNDDTPTPKSGWSKLMTEQTDCYGGIYKVLVPDGYNNINFGRFSTAQITDPTDWTNRWNQTSNLTIPTNPAKDYFTLTSKTGDNDYNGTWSNYTQSFQINFDLNKGGETFTTEPATAPAARCVASGSTTSAPTNPQAMGWEITGWYKESGKTHEWVFASQTVSEDQTLYAKWETVANKTIYLDASKVLSGSKNWDTDDVVLFAHAYINGTNLATDVKMTTALSSCDDHIYAFDIPGNADYVTFVRCASGASSIIWSGGSGNVYNQFSLAVEENKDWYYVDDWNAGTLKSTEFSPTTYSMSFATGSTTYTGGNAISGSKDSEGKACDVDYTLPGSAVFSTTGYTQTSWATEDGGSKAYDFGDDYKDNADQAFYPVWTINSHTLTWNWGGGSTSSDSYTAGGTVNYGATITYPANNTMSKTGYDFSSWSTDATTMPDNDLTITASWTIHTHKVSVASVSNATITATPAGASAIAEGSNNGSVNYGTTVTLNWPTPDTHYSNITWDVYKDGDSSTKVAVSGSGNGATFTLPDYDVIVSATAGEDAYKTVCFKNNGVGITGYTTQKVYVGERPSAPTLTDGYGTGDACDETSDKHYGWTQETLTSTIANKSTIDARTGSEAVYAKNANLPTVAAEDPSTITYHAVWAAGTAAPTINTTLLAKWDKQSLTASTAVKAKDKDGNTLNSVTMTPNVTLSNPETYTYSTGSGSISTYPELVLTGFDLSSYSSGSVSFIMRGSAKGDIQIYYKTSESDYTQLGSNITMPAKNQYTYEGYNIPNTATHIKIKYCSNTGNFYFGTVRIWGVNTSPTYTFTELNSTNTSGWATSDWDGYYIIGAKNSTNPHQVLSSCIGGSTAIRNIDPSDGVITTGDVGVIFKVTYSESNSGYCIQSMGANDYLGNAVENSTRVAPSFTPYYHYSIGYNSIRYTSDGSYIKYNWNNGSPIFGSYASGQTDLKLYKILTSYSTFRTTCCTTYDITLDGGGTISGAGTFSAGVDAACATETITLTKDICDGYTVGSWTIKKTSDGTDVTASVLDGNTLTMPAYGVTVYLSTTIKTSHFIDKLHRTDGYTDDGYAVSGCDQTVPTLSDASAPGVGETGCEEVHYKFVGWVPEANIASDGTLTGSPTILEGGTTDWDATGTDYVAVWAKIK